VTSAWLGIRLALTPAARLRTALVVLAAVLVSVVVLTTLAAGRYELTYSIAYQTEMPRLVLAAVAAVTLPCAVLLATVARLSAAMRDRRLANLRLIGLTPTQTRLVGAAETGGAALVGAVLGWLAFTALRPVLVDHPIAGRTWDQPFGPTALDQAAVLLGVPVVVVLAGLLPTRTTSRDPLSIARRADRTPPGWWRLAPLTLGAALCTVVLVQGHQTSSEATNQQVALFFAGAALLGLGLVLVLPALVRLLTRALTGRPLGAASRIAVRRLEAQPAGVARIIGALLVGLFLVTGARYVLVAFESTPQYLQAERNIEDEQRVSLMAQQHRVDTVAERAAAVDGVRDVIDLPTLNAGRFGTTAVVATCADLARVAPRIQGCRDGEAMWIDRSIGNVIGKRSELAWRAGDVHRRTVLTTPTDLPNMGNTNSWDALDPLWADAIIPPDQVGELPPDASHMLLVTGPPGRDLLERLNAVDLPIYTSADYSEYDFVAAMRGIIWTIAAVVLGVGLLALTIATVDRAVQRRKEVVALQLVGVAPRVVRRAQLLETAVPLTIGIVLAVGLGALGGATFLTLDETIAMPWTQTWRLAATGVLGGLVVAGVCMLAATPRLRPEEIRAE
jgi:putative ABC transport system permease protein